MIGVCLVAVFAMAKIATLWGRSLSWSVWSPVAFLWQDVLVATTCYVVTRRLRPSIGRVLYWGLVAVAAVTVPVERALSSPITLTMLRATSGTISASIAHYVTAANLGCIALVMATAGVAPLVLTHAWPSASRRAVVAALSMGALVVATGPFAATRVDTAGFDRNAVLTFTRSLVPRVRGVETVADWRATPPGNAPVEDLSRLHATATGRNVVFIVLESTAARYLSAYGATDDPTPHITALAKQGLLFEHAYTAYPESVKGIVAYLASRYPAFDIAADRHGSAMTPSLATILGTRGYATGLFHSGRFMYLGMDELLAHAGFSVLEDAGDIGGNHQSSFGVDEPATVAALLRWVDARPRGTPFFAAYLPAAGHHPYAHAAHGPWPDDTDINRYRNALHEGDEAIGTLLAGLRARGLDRSTLLVIFGDHGEAFGQHEGNYAHTLAIYDENVRVPLLFVLPGATAATRVQRTASLLDVAPTVLDLLGLEAPTTFQGVSLLAARPQMALFFTDYSLGLLGLRDGCTKYIYEMESKRSRMFDLCRDPDEQHDIGATQSARATDYRQLLERWSAAQVERVTLGGG